MTREQALAARPVRAVQATLEKSLDGHGAGGAKLVVPFRPRRRLAWLVRLPAGATKTFELDAIGLFVWEQCDGKTSVKQIIRKLARRYHLGLRQAEVPTVQFLRTLARKGLIGIAVGGDKDVTK